MVPIIRRATREELELAIAIDDQACSVFATIGLGLAFPPDHPFTKGERARWAQAANDGRLLLATTGDGTAIGMAALGFVDGAPYLDQLSVLPAAMRQGVGRRLLQEALAFAAGRPLWLTTYAHVPWNRPFYERYGFEVVPPADAPPMVRDHLEEQRRYLPAPDQRIVMRSRPSDGAG